ncbi:Sec7-domain-containing protein [Hesseltinella vesiculosa]|uniref:Sec7-domain-containing protein n=1 Tax=Hesseltinella vesiculosa TaxID=101127 RepID=A0A1X2GQJ0_9FUNG|nr:Sec7-domain-containing protein [Hesseltinella vesiculosa]
MRKNARWSGASMNSIHMGGLGMSMGLRKGKVNGEHDMSKNEANVRELDALILLNPFLEVIRSGNTTGPIAGTALGSVEKFLHYGIVGLHSANIAVAMNALSSGATHCKFEASDAASDELVLLRMLQVLQATLTNECGQVLSDEAVCEMMETGLSMCCQMRLSEMLRRSAEHVMIKMVVAIFERLKHIEDDWQLIDTPTEPEDELAKDVTGIKRVDSIAAIHMSTPRPSPSPSSSVDPTHPPPSLADASPGQNTPTPPPVTEPLEDQGTPTSHEDEPPVPQPIHARPPSPTQEDSTNALQDDTDENQEPIPLRSYGLPAIRELLRVLISLLNPHEHKHTDSMRMMALSILNVAFEVGGRSISRFESLRSLVTDDFCKYLFQLAKTDSTPLLQLTLRTIATVFDTFRPYLKLQQELFLFFLIERLSTASGHDNRAMTIDVDSEGTITFKFQSDDSDQVDVRSASPHVFLGRGDPVATKASYRSSHHAGNTPMALPGDIRELLLECLLQSARIPSFMVDLWFNYDCDQSCGDLFEELIQFLCKNSFPDTHNYSTSSYHLLCFDTLLMFMDHMVERVNNETPGSEDSSYVELTSSDELLERKARKRIVLEGALLFNESPKKGIEFLKENKIIVEDANGDINTSFAQFLLSTQQLNKKTLGEYLGKPTNFDLLQVYMRQFNFTGKRMDEALRMMLETFRLPGESQQIMRVTDTFSDTYYESSPLYIANNEAAQILAYSIILLNTDQHNPQVRRRMTLDDYMRNLRGVNNKQDFPKDFLKEIYEAIRQDEIVMPEEHEGRLGFNYAWKQLLYRSTQTGPFVVCDTSRFDRAIFELAWKPAIAAISYAFSMGQDDVTLEKAISGFHQCAMLSAHFELYDVFDSIVMNLASMTGLLETLDHAGSLPDPIVDVAGEKYVISSLAVRFGRNYKAQLAAVVVFAIVTRHGNSLRRGWVKILQIIRNLFVNSLLPSSMLQVEDFLSGTTSIPLKPKNPTNNRQQQQRDGSLLSALSSYLLSPYANDETYRADPTEEEVESTMCAVDCVASCRLEELFHDISKLHIEPLQALMSAISSVGYDHEAVKQATEPIPYDPATVLFLEFVITITIRNNERIDLLW